MPKLFEEVRVHLKLLLDRRAKREQRYVRRVCYLAILAFFTERKESNGCVSGGQHSFIQKN